MTVFSKKTPLEDPEDWDFLAINAVHAKKLHLIADGEELPPEIVEPEEPDEPKDPKEPEKPWWDSNPRGIAAKLISSL